MIKFTKMHGAGNDYIYIDARNRVLKKIPELAKAMSHRHYGAGSDGIILIMKSRTADFKMRMFNADGSEAEMCGNGIRCFAKYVFDRGLTKKKKIAVETLAGIKELDLKLKKGRVDSVRVDMGEPVLERGAIPMIGDNGRVVDEDLQLNGVKFQITALSVGNPHVVIFVNDVKNFPVEKYGPMIENHPLFPNRTNAEFVEIINSSEVIQRTWERGSGETMACGTGASAVAVAGFVNNRTSRKLLVHLNGGELELEWDEKTNHVFLTGNAVDVFDGVWPGA